MTFRLSSIVINCCVSETCIKAKHSFVPVNWYSVLENVSLCKSRGVAIVYRSHIKASVFPLHLDETEASSNIEMVAGKFQIGFNNSIIVVCLYRHPDYSKQTLKTTTVPSKIYSLCLSNLDFLFTYSETLTSVTNTYPR
jgi:penicillin V acylase-like amidase (Ntn superfamily)